jgi:hypothetical protein
MAPPPPPPQARGAAAIVDALWADSSDAGGACGCGGACACGCGACVVCTGEELVSAATLRAVRFPCCSSSALP